MADTFVRFCGSLRITLKYNDKPEMCRLQSGPFSAAVYSPATYDVRIFDRDNGATWEGNVRLPAAWSKATDCREAITATARAAIGFAGSEGFNVEGAEHGEDDYVITGKALYAPVPF